MTNGTHSYVGAVGLALLLTLVGCSAPVSEDAAIGRSATPTAASTAEAGGSDVTAELEGLEQEFGARVGVSALDTATGEAVTYRADERFGFASTLKVFAVAELLRQVPADQRDTRITWTQDDVDEAGYSPVTSEHVHDGLTLAELAEAAVRESDNAAMNLILDQIGGLAGLDDALAELGDVTTEVVNEEPDLNRIDPTGTADTTTPAAFTAALAALLRPENLRDGDRAVLIDWMSENATGDALVRAGAPDNWAVADKSGGAGAIRNDIAVVTPPDRAPILITVLTTKDDVTAEYDDALVARTAEIVLAALE
ncbi:class A beta-lactamase [Actinotalea sp. K2]|uniref:class A beta-lactamase n=1 Tax=Actinotalea sp. K2 TaxID=2939438 RepID=UPI00201766D4|nr:class A beta-lactamase [Actinotalea sp. K2]MCL3863282.1 class A beta-lactamase [Actinotalea sp. K2]